MPDDDPERRRGGDGPTPREGPPSAAEPPSSPVEEETLIAPSPASVDVETIESSALLRLLELPQAARLTQQGRLGLGGMGAVDLVIDPALGRRLAKKVMAPKLRPRRDAVDLFLREARITAQLDHPAIVPVHDLGFDTDGRLYFTMKVVEGETLAAYCAQLFETGEQELLFELIDVLIKVCNALAFAHSRGVVHGDLKPSNVMVGSFGEVYVMDWGLARVPAIEGAPSPADGDDAAAVGTPAFMAPEQANRQTTDERTDVFGIGALLYTLLTGRPPHVGETLAETIELARRCEVPTPAEIPGCAGIPGELESILMRAMAREPSARHGSMVELRDDLTRFLRGGHAFTRRHVPAGEHILREGDEGEEVYYLLRGRAEAYRLVEGERITLGEMTAGEVLGEMAILTSSRRTASVVALEDCTLVVVTPEALEREMQGMQAWMAALTRTLARRFRERERGSS